MLYTWNMVKQLHFNRKKKNKKDNCSTTDIPKFLRSCSIK